MGQESSLGFTGVPANLYIRMRSVRYLLCWRIRRLSYLPCRAHASRELRTLQLQPSESWDQQHAPPHPSPLLLVLILIYDSCLITRIVEWLFSLICYFLCVHSLVKVPLIYLSCSHASSLCFVETRSCYVVQSGLKLMILLYPPNPQCRD